ncbi:hypothetical protein C8R45DRAFT_515692 [Mycena sanguinolenta]|nr:hypothetical protein C8R45DRAFT_515692 [Mycena sanguinolenta]
MCRWRHVRNLYLSCGHAVTLPSIEVKCASTHCKFSPNHPAECVPPLCRQRCAQYHGYPEQYSLCPFFSLPYFHDSAQIPTSTDSARIARGEWALVVATKSEYGSLEVVHFVVFKKS